MTAVEYTKNFKPDQICTVNGNPVWDYKMVQNVDDDLELRLISEPVEGSKEYGYVVCQELVDYVGLWIHTKVIDETTGNEVNSI